MPCAVRLETGREKKSRVETTTRLIVTSRNVKDQVRQEKYYVKRGCKYLNVSLKLLDDSVQKSYCSLYEMISFTCKFCNKRCVALHWYIILYLYRDDKHQCDKPVVVLLLNDEQNLGYICYLYAGDAYTLNLPCFYVGLL